MPAAVFSSRLKFLFILVLLAVSPVPRPQIVRASQPPSALRISQVYGGSGVSGSTYTCDFVELFNSSNSPVAITGWSVQSSQGSVWAIIRLNAATIPAFSYYLLSSSSCGGSGQPLPAADMKHSSVSFSTASGQVALVSNVEGIKGVADPDVVDFVGFGSVTGYEGAGPGPATSISTSAQRKDAGCVDTNDNKTDLAALTPLARNSLSSTHACVVESAPVVTAVSPVDGATNVARDAGFTVTFSEGVAVSDEWFHVQCDLREDITPASATVSGGPISFSIDPAENLAGDDSCELTVFGAKVKDLDTNDPPDTLAGDQRITFATVPGACGDPAYPIHDLQGSGPQGLATGLTRTVEAVVVGDFQGSGGLDGYFMQAAAAEADGDAQTSEAIFVRDGGTTPLEVLAGDRVRLTGRVAEVDEQTALIDLARTVDCGAATLPPPVAVQLPVPSADWWERVEGMRVVFDEALTVAGSDELGSSGALRLVSGERPVAYTQGHAPGAEGYAAYRDELGRRTVVVDDGSDLPHPEPIPYPAPGLSAAATVRVGDTAAAGLVGIVDGRGGAFRVHPTISPRFVPSNPRPAPPARQYGNVRAVFLSLGDYFTPDAGVYGPRGAGNEEELTRQRDKLVSALAELQPDVLGVSRLENDGVEAGSALRDLVDGLNGRTGPGTFAAVGSGAAGWGAGEATVGLIYRVERLAPVGLPAILDSGAFSQSSPEPAHAASMAQTFEEVMWGERFTVVINQWRDRGACPVDGPDADAGDGQSCWNAARTAAAVDLAGWLASDPTGSDDADVLVLGELNAFSLEDPIRRLEDAGYASPVDRFAGADATTLLWDGQAGRGDDALGSSALGSQIKDAGVWAIDADEPAALDYQTENKSTGQLDSLYNPDAYRSSDRDPLFVDLSLLPDQSDLSGAYDLAWHTGQGAWRLGDAWGGADDGVLRDSGSWNDGRGEVKVSVSGPAGQYGCLYAWLDYSDGSAVEGSPDSPNGKWDDNEQVVDALPLAPGEDQLVVYPLPAGVIDGAATYNMRFRLALAPDPTVAFCATAGAAEPIGRMDGGEVEDWAFSSGPLAVRIGAFRARGYGSVTRVTWETVDEVDAAAFNLFVASASDGPWQHVNPAPIPAKAPGSTEGRRYDAECGWCRPSSWFRLEAIELSGARLSVGPVRAEESAPTAVRLAGTPSGQPTGPSSGDALLISAVFACAATAVGVYTQRGQRNR